MRAFPAVLVFFACIVLGASRSQAYVIDFSATGTADDIFCDSVANVSYCDQNKFQYGWYAPYIMLSDYDYSGRFRVEADPGTYFTPDSMTMGAVSNVWRANCDAQCTQDPSSYPFVNPSAFQLVAIPFLDMVAYRDGMEIFRTTFDPLLSVPSFDDRFRGISALDIFISRSYFTDARLEPDGYVYTCWLNAYSFCYNVSIDDFEFSVPPAPVPAPASGLLMIPALGLIGLVRMRRGNTSPSPRNT